MPSFTKINNNALFISEIRFGDGQIEALKNYLVASA